MSIAQRISAGSMICAAPGQVASELDGEAVILNLPDGVYYGLNAVGASIWRLVQQPATFDQVLEALLAEYEVEPEVCRRETLALLEELAGRGLLKVQDEGRA